MLYDLDISSGKPLPDFWTGIAKSRQLEFAIFALTPGIPQEYVHFTFGMRRSWVYKASHKIVDELRSVAEPLALENAASITVEDGYNMIKRIRGPLRKRRYTGRIPHWASIALMQECRARGWNTIATELCTTTRTLARWRKSCFHPLTLQPLRPAFRGERPYQVTR